MRRQVLTRILKDVLYPPSLWSAHERRWRHRSDVDPLECDAAASIVDQARDHPRQRALSRPAFADDAETSPASNLEIDVIDRENVVRPPILAP